MGGHDCWGGGENTGVAHHLHGLPTCNINENTQPPWWTTADNRAMRKFRALDQAAHASSWRPYLRL